MPAPTPEATYRPYPERYSDTCYQADNHDAADLCAQWRAAIAAEKAADEARLATIAAIVGTVLSLVTIIGLIITIWQTNGALAEARRGNRLNLLFERRSRREARKADVEQARALEIASISSDAAVNLSKAATEANEITRLSRRNADRAWMSNPDFNIEINPDSQGLINAISFFFIMRNVGRTPALNCLQACCVSPPGGKAFFTKPIPDDIPRTTITPGSERATNLEWFQPREVMASKDAPIEFLVKLSYEDIFVAGETHINETLFSIRYVGRGDLRKMPANQLLTGNFLVTELSSKAT